MRIAEQLAVALTEKKVTEEMSPYDIMDNILSDSDKYVHGPLAHELENLKHALDGAYKTVQGLAKAGAGRTEHDTIMDRNIMPAWQKFESAVTDMGGRIKRLQAAMKNNSHGV